MLAGGETCEMRTPAVPSTVILVHGVELVLSPDALVVLAMKTSFVALV